MVDKLKDIVKKIEDNVGIGLLPNKSINFRTIGGKRYIQVNTKVGTREFRNMEQCKGARLMLLVLSESNKKIDEILHGKEEFPDLTQKGTERKR